MVCRHRILELHIISDGKQREGALVLHRENLFLQRNKTFRLMVKLCVKMMRAKENNQEQ